MFRLINKSFYSPQTLTITLVLSFFICNITYAETFDKKLALGGAGSVQNNSTVGNAPAGVSSPKPVVTVPTTNSSQSNSGITLTPGAGGTYTLLAPIPTFFPEGKIDVKGGGLGGYLNGLYRAGIAVATGLALIMIVVGGLEYVSTDSIQGKSNGRERIKNAIIGLLLALTSFIILRQINPNLLKSDLNVESTQSTGTVGGSAVTLVNRPPVDSLAAYPTVQGIVNQGLQGVPGFMTGGGTTAGGGVLTSSAMGARILEAARSILNQKICYPAATENGNKGCGFAFGLIMQRAGITFKNLNPSTILSTVNINSVLKSDSRFYLVTSDVPSMGRVINMNLALPGDIIISPSGYHFSTRVYKTGHVGIVESAGAGRIISNDSGDKEIQSNYTGSSWLNRYRTKQGLDTYIYRYR
jgi:hypothetical protein